MDGEMATRMAGETRPLSLPNTGNKMISACVVWPLSRVAGDRAASAQGGFLRGRQLIDSTIEVDRRHAVPRPCCLRRPSNRCCSFCFASRVSERCAYLHLGRPARIWHPRYYRSKYYGFICEHDVGD
eukprot:1662976-Pyramimonas_sp.AAC.1